MTTISEEQQTSKGDKRIRKEIAPAMHHSRMRHATLK
jgi:hypothetical protein